MKDYQAEMARYHNSRHGRDGWCWICRINQQHIANVPLGSKVAPRQTGAGGERLRRAFGDARHDTSGQRPAALRSASCDHQDGGQLLNIRLCTVWQLTPV